MWHRKCHNEAIFDVGEAKLSADLTVFPSLFGCYLFVALDCELTFDLNLRLGGRKLATVLDTDFGVVLSPLRGTPA